MKEKIAVAEYHRSVLGVSAPFDLRQLKAGYRRLMKEWHPDRFFSDRPKHADATEKAKHFNLAFEFLSELVDELGGTYSFDAQSKNSHSTKQKHDSKAYEYRPKRQYQGKAYTVGFPDSSVTEIFLQSSHIISTGYKGATKELYIKFNGDRVYRYFGFPESLFHDFVAAESPGRFANKLIYPDFKYERCR